MVERYLAHETLVFISNIRLLFEWFCFRWHIHYIEYVN